MNFRRLENRFFETIFLIKLFKNFLLKIAKMFKSLSLTQFFQEKIVSLLSTYLRDFSRSNISQVLPFIWFGLILLQLNLGLNSTLEMENLEIREDLLLKQSLPFVINEGKIGRITINVSQNRFELKLMSRYQLCLKIHQ